MKNFSRKSEKSDDKITPKRSRNNENDIILQVTTKYDNAFSLQRKELSLEDIERTKTYCFQIAKLTLWYFCSNSRKSQRSYVSDITKISSEINIPAASVSIC